MTTEEIAEDFENKKYDDNWPQGSLEEFIWERCEMDNLKVREIMRAILSKLSKPQGRVVSVYKIKEILIMDNLTGFLVVHGFTGEQLDNIYSRIADAINKGEVFK